MSAPLGILQVDKAGNISLANRRLEAMFGYEHEELLGRSGEQLIPGKFRWRHREHRRLFILDPHDRPMGKDLDITERRKDGSKFPVRGPLVAATGRTAGGRYPY